MGIFSKVDVEKLIRKFEQHKNGPNKRSEIYKRTQRGILLPKQKTLKKAIGSFQENNVEQFIKISEQIADLLKKTPLFIPSGRGVKFFVPPLEKKEVKRKRENPFQPEYPDKMLEDLSSTLAGFFINEKLKRRVSFDLGIKIFRHIEAIEKIRPIFIEAGVPESSFDVTVKKLLKWTAKDVFPWLLYKSQPKGEDDLMKQLYAFFRDRWPKEKLADRAIFICIAYLFKTFIPKNEVVGQNVERIKKFFQNKK